MMKKCFAVAILLILFSIFISCSKNETIQSINENELFQLSYGKFAQQLSVNDLNNSGEVRYGIAMQDGFFYIVNGDAQKIMELNSYGDLLTLFYNEDSQTAKFIENSKRPEECVRHEISYPFEYPGSIAIDSNKTIYAVSSIPKDRQEQSEDGAMLFCQTVLRMSRDGSNIDYIGQQGPGGTPFPYIKQVFTTTKDELVVISISTEGKMVYWFTKEGFLKFMIPIYKNTIPLIKKQNEQSEIFLSIENVVPDPVNYKLYVQVDYYSTYFDEDSKVQSGINYIQTLLYPFDIETGVYENPLTIPAYEESVVSDYSKLTYRIPYDCLGVTKSGWKFFIVKTESGFNIEMLQGENQRILRRQFKVDHNKIIFDSMALSLDGIITALYLENESARVVWYRTDSLIDAIVKN